MRAVQWLVAALALTAAVSLQLWRAATAPVPTEADLPAHLRDWREAGRVETLCHVGPAQRDGAPCVDLFVRWVLPTAMPAVDNTVPVLLIHGFPSSSYEWHRVATPLAEALRAPVLVFDQLGYGFSDKPAAGSYPYTMVDQADAALALWRALGIREAHVVAHDMGDTVLCEILGRRHRGELPPPFSDAGFFRSVTFTNGGMYYREINPRVTQTLLTTPGIGAAFQQAINVFDPSAVVMRAQLRTVWAPGYADAATRDADIDDIVALLRLRGGHWLLHRLIRYLADRAELEHRWHPALTGRASQTPGGHAIAPPPCALVWGDADAVAPLRVAKAVEALGGCTLRTLPGVGHFAQLEAPDAWVDAVSAAIRAALEQ